MLSGVRGQQTSERDAASFDMDLRATLTVIRRRGIARHRLCKPLHLQAVPVDVGHSTRAGRAPAVRR